MGNISYYLGKAGKFALDTVRESASRHDEEVIGEANNRAISITTSALYEAKVKDDVIIKMLQKHWNLTDSDARERLRIEKTIEYPCRTTAEYLMSEVAMTREEADEIIAYQVVNYLSHNKFAWKLTPGELLKKAGVTI